MQLNAHVKLSTTGKEEFEGTVWGFDKDNTYVVLQSPGDAPGESCLHFVSKAALAKDGVKVVKPPPQQPLPTLHTLCPLRTAERLDKASKTAEQDAARMGDGVSVLAQHMFDAINKTMPCTWDKTVIVVLDEVRIVPPYAPDNCTTRNPRDTATMDRVRKVLEMEARKISS